MESQITFTQAERESFQNALKDFVQQVKDCAKNKTIKGSKRAKLKEIFDEALKNIQYCSNPNFGSGNLNRESCCVSFYRNDLLREEFVNGNRPSLQKGIYIWFGYYYGKNPSKFILKFGFPEEKIEKSRCVGVNKIEEDGALKKYDFTYENLDSHLEQITDNFLEMANYFSSFDPQDFAIPIPHHQDSCKSRERYFWLCKGGEKGNKWEEMYQKNLIGIGWRELGDLKQYKDKIEIQTALNKYYPTKTQDRKNDRTANWEFCHEMQVGDIVIVGNGREEFLGYGEVISDYFYDPHCDDTFASFRKIRWIQKGKWTWQKRDENDGGWASKTLTNITPYQESLRYLLFLIGFESGQNQGHQSHSPLNCIFYGPPGTGKTYTTIDRALEILNIDHTTLSRKEKKQRFNALREKQIEFITFHQSYSYEEFIEGIKPKIDEENPGDIQYEIKEGIFKQICTKAKDDPSNRYILIIDEINRGNISKIFGELITLIEPSKRLRETEELKVKLPYSNELFGVPNNLYIIGTMNTVDRSIALLDTALRRRFEFIEMMPDPQKLKEIWIMDNKNDKRDEKEEQVQEEIKTSNDDITQKDSTIILHSILEAINTRLEFLLDREHTIGHAFFFEKARNRNNQEQGTWYELTLEDLKSIFKNKILPLLQEYFYDDYEKIKAVLNDNKMIVEKKCNPNYLKALDHLRDEEKKLYAVTDSTKWDIKTFIHIYETPQDQIKSLQNE